MKLYPATAIILSMLLLGGLSNAATADTPLAGADGSAVTLWASGASSI